MEDNFKIAFNILVHNVNILNPNIRLELIPRLNSEFKSYLEQLIAKGEIYEYSYKLERIGQSKIKCSLNYMDKLYGPMKELIIESYLKSPSEVREKLFNSFANIVIDKKYDNVELPKPIITYNLK